MNEYLAATAASVRFDTGRATKADLFRGGRLFADLNCFEPGQRQSVHTHSGAEKFYFLVSGKARLAVGACEMDAVAGDIVWAPPHLPRVGGDHPCVAPEDVAVCQDEGDR